MNARQKAKKYKKIAELYRIKAEAHDRYMRSEALKRQLERTHGEIKTLKIVKHWDDRFPEELVKEDICREFGNFCLENNLIDFEVSDYDQFTMARRIVATIIVAKKWEDEE